MVNTVFRGESGRQPRLPPCRAEARRLRLLAGRRFCSRKTSKDFSRAKVGFGGKEDNGGLPPTQGDDDVQPRFRLPESVSALVNRGYCLRN